MMELEPKKINLLRCLEEYIMNVMTSSLKDLLLISNKTEKKEILKTLNEISEGRKPTEIKLSKSKQDAVENIVFLSVLGDMVHEKLQKLMD